jgi:hypothetical protein
MTTINKVPANARDMLDNRAGSAIRNPPGKRERRLNWVRTSAPSLVRRKSTVAGRRSLPPEAPACWTDRRLTSLCAAQCLLPLAPRLAPQDLG